MDLNQKVSTMLKACFGELQDLVCIRKTLRFGIASMLHHFDAANEFHTNSPLAMSPVFRKQEFIELRDSVRVVYPWENDSIAQKCVMKLTGVPHHVVQLAAIELIKTIFTEVQLGLLKGVEKMLDDCTMGGTLSETRMKSILEESRKKFVEELDQRMPTTANNMPWSATGNGTDHTELMGEHKIWIHKGKFRRVPPDWKFPKCGLLVAYKLWHTKDTVSGQCAMKFLKPMDVDFLTDGRRRLEEFTLLMRRLDLAAHEKGLLHQEMSDLHCRKAFDIVASSLGVPTFTPKGRRRHLERTKWPTYLRIMPNKVRVGAKPHFFSTNQISDKQCL